MSGSGQTKVFMLNFRLAVMKNLGASEEPTTDKIVRFHSFFMNRLFPDTELWDTSELGSPDRRTSIVNDPFSTLGQDA